MKCGIITVYQSENCGSFLQAYALMNAIESLGYDAYFPAHSFYDHSVSCLNLTKTYLKLFLKGNLKGVKFTRQRRKNFKKALKILKTCKQNAKLDTYFFGSDVIWDLSSFYFKNHADFFWGYRFKDVKKIAYATSVGFATQEQINENKWIPSALKEYSAIGVRDDQTKNCLKPLTDIEMEMVCDPTLLLKVEDYEKIAMPVEYENYILTYYYGKMEDSGVNVLKQIAKEENLKIISLTYSRDVPWADIVEAFDPLRFLSLIKNAKYVITNSFHGTVFSNIFNKKFVCFKIKHLQKATDFLQRYKMDDKQTDNGNAIRDILHSDYDYNTTQKLIEETRDKGIAFIKNALR